MVPMVESFRKILSEGERNWNFIYITPSERDLFPEERPFKLHCRGEIFKVALNKAGRIVSKDLFEKLNPPRKGIIIITKRSENEFQIAMLNEGMKKITPP